MNTISGFPTRPQRRRYSQEERETIVEQARRMRVEGMKMAAIVLELGVSSWTLSKWLKATNHAPTFLPVQVVAPVSSSALTLVTPAGYRVEGLTMDAMVALLSRIG